MTNSTDPDQLASSELYTVCKGRVYPGSAGQGLRKVSNSKKTTSCLQKVFRQNMSSLSLAFAIIFFDWLQVNDTINPFYTE